LFLLLVAIETREDVILLLLHRLLRLLDLSLDKHRILKFLSEKHD
jgi:hypothetical protein